MKMKRLFTLCAVFAQISLLAQSNSNGESLYMDGIGYLRGVTKGYNPELAKSLFYQASNLGYAPAMNALGNFYSNAISASEKNLDSAIFWYQRAANAGYSNACYNIGNLYRTGTGLTQNFSDAFKY